MPLHLVPQPEPQPEEPRKARRQRLARLSKDAGMLTCHSCAGIEVMETKVGVRVVAGKPRGGTKQMICATCWRNGERVVLA